MRYSLLLTIIAVLCASILVLSGCSAETSDVNDRSDRTTPTYCEQMLKPMTPEEIDELSSYVLSFSDGAADQGKAAAGEQLYIKRGCVACHMFEGEGFEGLAPDLTDNDWIYGGSLDDIKETIREGRPLKPDPDSETIISEGRPQNQDPNLRWIMLGTNIGALVGLCLGVVATYKVHPILGLLTLIGGLKYIATSNGY